MQIKLTHIAIMSLIILATGIPIAIGLGTNMVKPTTTTTTVTTNLTNFVIVSTVTKTQNQTITVYRNITTTVTYNAWFCHSWIEQNGTWIDEGFFFDEDNFTTVYTINATANFWILCKPNSTG
jgi:hypothetical protein